MDRISRRDFLKTGAAVAVGGTALSGGGWAYVKNYEPDDVEIVNQSLTLPHLGPAFNGYRLLQVSDIHTDDWMYGERLADRMRLIQAQSPDLMVITGDFVTRRLLRNHLPDLAAGLKTLKARDGVLAVLGNHDHWAGADVIRGMLEQVGVIDIGNNVFPLQRGDASLYIAGVDDVYVQMDRLSDVLDRLPGSGAAILLAHEPDFADTSAAAGRFDLQLSGHSHGGQVVVPPIGPLILPDLGQKYPSGLYRVGDMIQYTNRGLGMLSPKVRFNCRPEITLFTLRSPMSHAG
jgi:predicted MPP superfamily phosphohydrolase